MEHSHQVDEIEVKFIRRIVRGRRQNSRQIANLLKRFERIFDLPGIPVFDYQPGTTLHHRAHVGDTWKFDHTIEPGVVAYMLENVGERFGSI